MLFDAVLLILSLFFFFFNDTATTEIYTLSLHDALPISMTSPSLTARRRRSRAGSMSGSRRGSYSTRAPSTKAAASPGVRTPRCQRRCRISGGDGALARAPSGWRARGGQRRRGGGGGGAAT